MQPVTNRYHCRIRTSNHRRALSQKSQTLRLAFRFILLLACTTSIGATSDSSRTSSAITVELGSFLCIPLASQAPRWEPYPVAGMQISLPTGIERLSGSASVYAGIIEASPPLDQELLTIEFEFSLSYRFFLRAPYISIGPAVGLNSMAVFSSPSFEIDRNVFSTSESEFGPSASLETTVQIRRWRVSVPVRLVCILSEPDVFMRADVGLHLGREF